MSDTDSFIDEVSEELRRDRLYSLFRKWGWIPILVVVLIVGGAAYFEYQRGQAQAQAQAFGDALLAALDGEDPEARIAALEGIEADTPQATILLALYAAGEAAGADEAADAAARLRAAAETPDLDPLYGHLALLKAQMIDPAPEDEARLVLEALAVPGAPYAALAEEQLALVDARAGDIEAATDRLRAIERSAVATAGLQQRAAQLIVALESGAVLLDTAPVEEEAEDGPVDAAVPVDLGTVAEEPEDAAPEEAAPEDDLAPETGTETDAEGEAPEVDAEADGEAPDAEADPEAEGAEEATATEETE